MISALGGKRSPDVEEIYRPQRHFYDFDYNNPLILDKLKASHGGDQFESQQQNTGTIAVTTEVVTEFQSLPPPTQHSSRRMSLSTSEGNESERKLVVKWLPHFIQVH